MQKYLVCVTESNNNKFYQLTQIDSDTWEAKWGRVGCDNPSKQDYPMSQWEKKYNEKIKKGYKDITGLRSESASSSFSYSDVSDRQIQTLLDTLQKYAKQTIQTNYTISSENVTQAQIDTAQDIINYIANRINNIQYNELNEKLKELYITIPRKMNNVKNYLLSADDNRNVARKLIKNEQDLLDVMSQQVSMVKPTKSGQTLEDALGIKITTPDDDEIKTLKTMMGSNISIFKKVYKIENIQTQNLFEKQKDLSVKKWTKLLFHGSRNENWLSIIKEGLRIRPSNAVITGAMFGHGIYFADKCQKSLGYTSFKGSIWAGGRSGHAYLAVYEVNTGMEYRIEKHTDECYKLNESRLKAKGEYDSLFAKGGIDLKNNEYIVYNQNKCTIKYLIEIEE